MHAYRFHRAAFLLAGLLVVAIHPSPIAAGDHAVEPREQAIPAPIELTLVANHGRTLSSYERGFADGFRARSLMGRAPAIYRRDGQNRSWSNGRSSARALPYWRGTPSNRGWNGATREAYGWTQYQRNDWALRPYPSRRSATSWGEDTARQWVR